MNVSRIGILLICLVISSVASRPYSGLHSQEADPLDNRKYRPSSPKTFDYLGFIIHHPKFLRNQIRFWTNINSRLSTLFNSDQHG